MALSNNDWIAIGDFIKSELNRRKTNRFGLETLWKEVDRQIAMEPIARQILTGEKQDWFPNIELPLQFNALEVIAADARRLKFPRSTEWFRVSSEVSDEYAERFQTRREKFPLIGRQAVPVKLDQETADVLVKMTMNHYHRTYDFRSNIDLVDTECIKYGTGIARVTPVKSSNFTYDFRGLRNKNLVGPAVIPCSIKNTYLDDTPTAILHEGVVLAPSIIRTKMQNLDALKRAAKAGGPEKGWIFSQLNKIKDPADDEGRRGFVEMIEFEGDLMVPKTRGSIFLPNVIVTVAVHAGPPRPVRFRESPVPFRSYAVGHYMRDDVASPYGSSPLMKGQPIQEAATEVFNNLMAVAALNGQPPILYDRHEVEFAGSGGPVVFPGATFKADAPNALETLEIGDLSGLLNAYLALLKQYEDLTGANDPRRGAPIKSHTTRGGAELEASRGIARTDDFVTAQEQGQITSILHMEYEIIKDVMKSPQPVSVGSGGIEGWVNISQQDLPDNVNFLVEGSSGTINQRERAENFLAATNFAVELATTAAEMGVNVPLKFKEMIVEGYNQAGIQNANQFVGEPQALPAPNEGGSPVPGANGGIPAGGATAVAPTV